MILLSISIFYLSVFHLVVGFVRQMKLTERTLKQHLVSYRTECVIHNGSRASPDDISIGSAALAQLKSCPTDTQADRPRYSGQVEVIM